MTILVHNLLVLHRAKPPPQNNVGALLTIGELTT
jgi:hypothetical protein